MTVRTTSLGGTDWAGSELLTASDLNDTLERMVYLQPIGQRVDTFGGTGALGGSTITTNGTFLADRIYNFTNFKVNSGVTWTMSGGNFVIFKCTGSFELAGSLSAYGMGGAGGIGETNPSTNDAQTGTAGFNGTTGGTGNNGTGGGGGGGGYYAGSNGTNSVSGYGLFGWKNASYNLGYTIPATIPFWGAGGGGGAYDTSGKGDGGPGGGLIIVEVVGSCILNGHINVAGSAGSTFLTSQGGGGGGGCAIILMKGPYSTSGQTWNITGGASGGTKAGTGGSGAYSLIRVWDGLV